VPQRTTVYGKTAREARDKAEEVRRRLRAHLPAKDKKITLGAFAESWITSTLAASDRKPSTKSLYATLALKHIIAAKLGAQPLDRLKPSHVEAWKVELQGRGLSTPGYVAARLSRCAGPMWTSRLMCCEYGARSPGSMAPWSSPSPRRRSLGGRCRSPRRPGGCFAKYAPLRLRSGSGQAQHGSRRATCSQPSSARPTSRVTPCGPSSRPRRTRACLTSVCTRCATAAAVMLVNGVPLKAVSEVLGHASIGITGDIYGHVSPDISRDALARLSEALG
jgi:hypothetical protein